MSVSNAGVTKSTKEEIRGLISSEFIKQWPDAQVNSNGPIGVIIAAMTESSYNINQSLLQGYNQLFLETATGTFLDSIAAQNGITRIRERFATATVTFTGRDGYLIPSGTLVRAPSNGVIFETTQSVQISIGTADVIAKATTAGDVGNVPTGSITALVSALPGVVSVNNAADAFGGGGTETDEELRLRIKTTINSYGSFPMLTRRLYDIPGVSSVDILENLTNVTSSEGLPPKSISILINGGENDQIGKCLYDYLPVGTQTHGDQKVDVINPFGRVVSYRFVRPLLKVINVNVTLSLIHISEPTRRG